MLAYGCHEFTLKLRMSTGNLASPLVVICSKGFCLVNLVAGGIHCLTVGIRIMLALQRTLWHIAFTKLSFLTVKHLLARNQNRVNFR